MWPARPPSIRISTRKMHTCQNGGAVAANTTRRGRNTIRHTNRHTLLPSHRPVSRESTNHPIPPGPPGEFLLGHRRTVAVDETFKQYAKWGKEYSILISLFLSPILTWLLWGPKMQLHRRILQPPFTRSKVGQYAALQREAAPICCKGFIHELSG